MYRAQLRNLNRPIAVDRQRHLPVDLPGKLQKNLIARSQYIARAYRHILHRRKRRRNPPEQRSSVDLQLLSRRGFHHLLERARRLGRQRRLILARLQLPLLLPPHHPPLLIALRGARLRAELPQKVRNARARRRDGPLLRRRYRRSRRYRRRRGRRRLVEDLRVHRWTGKNPCGSKPAQKTLKTKRLQPRSKQIHAWCSPLHEPFTKSARLHQLASLRPPFDGLGHGFKANCSSPAPLPQPKHVVVTELSRAPAHIKCRPYSSNHAQNRRRAFRRIHTGSLRMQKSGNQKHGTQKRDAAKNLHDCKSRGAVPKRDTSELEPAYQPLFPPAIKLSGPHLSRHPHGWIRKRTEASQP